MPRFHLEKTADVGIEKLFGIVTGFERFEETMPRHFPSVRVLSSRGNVSVVEEHVVVSGRELVMMTKHVVERPHTHEVFVIGGDAKGSHILETFSPAGQGTRIMVDADIKLRGMMRIAGYIYRNRIRRGFAEIIDELVALSGN